MTAAARQQRNSFNITLTEADAETLRLRAQESGVAPTTLAGRLVASALASRDGSTVLAEITTVGEALQEVSEGVAKALLEAVKTRRDLTNATLKILSELGIPPERANAWVQKHLHPPVEGRSGA